MDNYDLSNLLLLADSAHTRERHPRLTDEQNKRATFSKRSTTVTTTEQAEPQQLPSTGDEQIPGQRVLADFDISLTSNIPAPLIVDEPVVDEPEDPFAALAAYQPRTFDNDTQQPLESNLGLLGESNTSEVVLAEPDGNDVHGPLEQSQGESDTRGISIPESAISDTVSGRRRASEPESSSKKSIDPHFQESSRRFDQLTIKKRKLEGAETEFLLLPRAIATRSQSAAIPEKSATSQKNTRSQNCDKSLWERVKRETEKWIVKCEGVEKKYMCSHPNCGFASIRVGDLKKHIFAHTHISIFKCAHPKCADNPYFRDTAQLRRHQQSYHTLEKPYRCSLCDTHFGRLDNYKRHMFNKHKLIL